MATYYVNTNMGADTNSGTTANTAWRTISKSITVAVAGDTVNISSGTYNEQCIFTATATALAPLVFAATNPGGVVVNGLVSLQGAYTTVSGFQSGLGKTSALPSSAGNYNGVPLTPSCFAVYGTHNTLSGASVIGTQANPILGAGQAQGATLETVIYELSGTFNTISACTCGWTQDADQIRIDGDHNTIDNWTGYGRSNPSYNWNNSGAIHADMLQMDLSASNCVVQNSLFYNCQPDVPHQFGMWNATGNTSSANSNNVWRNNIVLGGDHFYWLTQTSSLYNNLWYGSAQSVGDLLFLDQSTYSGYQIKNNIFYVCGTGTGDGFIQGNSLANTTATNNYFAWVGDVAVTHVVGTSALNGGAPGFVNSPGRAHANDALPSFDFHLLSSSQLRGAGANLTSTGFSTDKDGKGRPGAGAWDIGPYQFSSTTGAMTVVKSGVNANSTANSITVSYGANVSAGNALVAEMSCLNSSAAFTVTDSIGNTWTRAVLNVGNGVLSGIFYVPSNLASAANTVTVSTAGSNGFLEVVLYEIQYTAGTTWTLSAISTSLGSTATTFSGAVSTTGNQFVVGYINITAISTGITSAGWIGGATIADNYQAYLLATTSGSNQLTGTQGNAATYNGLIAAFGLTTTGSGISVPTNVQAAHGISTSGNTLGNPFAGNVTAGNGLIIAIACANATATVSSITDTLGNTWTLANSGSGAGLKNFCYYCKANASGANNVTVTLNASGGFLETVTWEFAWTNSGVITFDQGSSATGTSANATSGVTPTRTVANELLVGYIQLFAAFSSIAAGWTGASTANQNIQEYKIVTATGTDAATGTQVSSAQYLGLVSTFYGATTATVPNILAGICTARANNTGVLRATKPLAAVATARANHTGVLTGPFKPLSGTATGRANHTGTLIVTNRLSGTATARANHAGTLSVPIRLTGTATMRAQNTGILSVTIIFTLYPVPGWNLLYSVYSTYTIIFTVPNLDYSWLFLQVTAGPFETYQAALTYQLASGLL